MNIPDNFIRCAIHDMRNMAGMKVTRELIEQAIFADKENAHWYEEEFELIDYDNVAESDVVYGLDTAARELVADSIALYLLKVRWPTYGNSLEDDTFFDDLEKAIDKWVKEHNQVSV